eukprot:6185243-Pleurochrysis_carterae.AAC.7
MHTELYHSGDGGVAQVSVTRPAGATFRPPQPCRQAPSVAVERSRPRTRRLCRPLLQACKLDSSLVTGVRSEAARPHSGATCDAAAASEQAVGPRWVARSAGAAACKVVGPPGEEQCVQAVEWLLNEDCLLTWLSTTGDYTLRSEVDDVALLGA